MPQRTRHDTTRHDTTRHYTTRHDTTRKEEACLAACEARRLFFVNGASESGHYRTSQSPGTFALAVRPNESPTPSATPKSPPPHPARQSQTFELLWSSNGKKTRIIGTPASSSSWGITAEECPCGGWRMLSELKPQRTRERKDMTSNFAATCICDFVNMTEPQPAASTTDLETLRKEIQSPPDIQPLHTRVVTSHRSLRGSAGRNWFILPKALLRRFDRESVDGLRGAPGQHFPHARTGRPP